MHPNDPHMSGPRWMWMPMDPPTFGRLFAWHPQPIPLSLLFGVVLALGYVALLVVQRRRGRRWPVSRTIMFALGFGSIVVLCGSALNGYSMALFSVHMVQHMLLSMLTPPLLLAGRPLTLALEALEGSRLRAPFAWFAQSRLTGALAFPPVALLVFLGGMYGLYYTPLFDHLMANWATHELMLVFYVVSGLFLYWPVLGLDPCRVKLSRPIAFIASILPTPFHSFFAVIVMESTALLMHTFAHPDPMWHVDPVVDQQLGGGLAWAFADIPGLLLVGIIAVQWWRTSRAEAVDSDRYEAEHDDERLNAYNDWLAGAADEPR